MPMLLAMDCSMHRLWRSACIASFALLLEATSNVAQSQEGQVYLSLCEPLAKTDAERERCAIRAKELDAAAQRVVNCRDNQRLLIGLDRQTVKQRCGDASDKMVSTSVLGTSET